MKTIFLYGAAASGKTTLGRKLSSSLGCSWIDLDAEIERRAGKTVSSIFAEGGESAFRALESEVLTSLLEGDAPPPSIISLGGGTLLDGNLRRKAEEHGVIWRIETPAQDELEKRILAGGNTRPLGNLSMARREHYDSFPHKISRCFFLDGSVVAIGENLPLPDGIAQLCVADSRLLQIYGKTPGNAPSISIPSGERHKSMRSVVKIWQALMERGLGRKSRLIAFGGGVAGDMAGFAASSWMRGIGWINVPTTLLAMVDASTGGKTGFDFMGGKNLIGAFHAPQLVLIDASYLKTLDRRETKNGIAEMVKHRIIAGIAPMQNPLCPTSGEIAANLEVKVNIVKEDPFEKSGKRILLNCGHTIGHAVESASRFKVKHGEAVAIGMLKEAKIAAKLGLASPLWPQELKSILEKASLPASMPCGMDMKDLIPLMEGDKKKEGGGIVTFALPCAIGDVRAVPLRPGEIHGLL